jgi:autotransporter-associated beta strand protein
MHRIVFTILTGSLVPISAQTIWTGGGGDNNWSTANNWNNNVVAANPSLAVLNFAGGVRLTNTVNANWTVAGINFTNTAGAFNIGSSGGSTLTINGSGIVNADNSLQTLSSAIALGTNQTWSTTSTGNLAVSGTINTAGFTLSTSPTVDAARTITLSGAVSGAGSLTVGGVGTTILSGATANTYSGVTTINSGGLRLQKTAGVNAIAGNITIGDGTGTDTLTLAANNQIADTSAVTLNAAGTPVFNLAGFTERVGSIASSNTGASITLGNNGSLTAGDAANTTYAGAITGTGTASFTKQGSGTTVLTGANSYAGTTTISAGTLQVGNAGTSGTLGTGAVSNNAALSFNRTDSQTVANAISGTGALTQAGSGTTTLTGTNSFTGGAAVTAGTLVLQNGSAIGAGTVGTVVSSGATLRLDGGVTAANNGTLSLAGTGVAGAGALVGANAINRWSGNLALTADATVSTSGANFLALGSTSPAWNRAINDPLGNTPFTPGFEDLTTFALGGNTLTLTGTTSAGDNRAIYVNARMTGAGNVVINMTNPADVARFTANVNTYTGSTTVKNGTLSMSTTPNTYPGDTVNPGYFGINGALIVGDGSGAANSARYITGAGTSSQGLINYNSSLTLHRDGQVNLNATQTFTGVTFNGGAIDLGSAGGLYLNDTLTVNASAGNTATITGTGTSTLSLTIQQGPNPVPNADRTFNIVGGVGNTSDLTLNAVVNNGSITKTGIGTMSIINNNSGGYEGTTTINNGILNIQHGNALGQAGNNPANATTVNSGGTLQLSNVANGNFTSNAGEQLYLNGTGYLGNGALQNLAGNNTWAGSTFLTTNARIQSESGNLLTLTGTMNSSSNSTLDVRGSGNTTISGTVGIGSGGITKNGTGTLILSGTNTYGGTTLIQEGVLSLQNSAGLGGLGTTTVASLAALHLDSTANGNLLGGDATTITGTGIGGTGAIRNVLGANNYTGQVTLAGSSLVTANSATTLTLSGGTTGAGQDLTVGTTAQNGNVVISGAMSNGTGQLTKAGSGDLTFGRSTGITGTVGLTHLDGGTLTVGLDTGTLSTLNTKAIDSALGTVLKIGSSGKVLATYDTNATMFGTIDEIAASGGTFEKAGAGTLTFATSFNFDGNLILSGGTLALANSANVTFGNIFITQNMTIDFGSGTSTILSSANLFISAGVQVSVINWVNNGAGGTDDIWYATSGFAQTAGPSATLNGTPTPPNTNPENQITFSGIAPASHTSWVSNQGGQYYDNEIRPIPEPSTYGALFFSACLGLFAWRRFRAKHAALH